MTQLLDGPLSGHESLDDSQSERDLLGGLQSGLHVLYGCLYG
jgi:hypothetical protein